MAEDEDALKRAKAKAARQASSVSSDADFTSPKERGQILGRLDAVESHFATKADLHTTQLAISGVVIATLVALLSIAWAVVGISVGANIALFRMLVGVFTDADTSVNETSYQAPRPSPPGPRPMAERSKGAGLDSGGWK